MAQLGRGPPPWVTPSRNEVVLPGATTAASGAAEEVIGGVGRARRQRLRRLAEELDPGIADRVAARRARVPQREAELAVAGRPLTAEVRQREHRRPGTAGARRVAVALGSSMRYVLDGGRRGGCCRGSRRSHRGALLDRRGGWSPAASLVPVVEVVTRRSAAARRPREVASAGTDSNASAHPIDFRPSGQDLSFRCHRVTPCNREDSERDLADSCGGRPPAPSAARRRRKIDWELIVCGFARPRARRPRRGRVRPAGRALRARARRRALAPLPALRLLGGAAARRRADARAPARARRDRGAAARQGTARQDRAAADRDRPRDPLPDPGAARGRGARCSPARAQPARRLLPDPHRLQGGVAGGPVQTSGHVGILRELDKLFSLRSGTLHVVGIALLGVRAAGRDRSGRPLATASAGPST